MLPEIMKPYKLGQRIFPSLIKKCPFLKHLPIFRQYTKGGKYDPDGYAVKMRHIINGMGEQDVWYDEDTAIK